MPSTNAPVLPALFTEHQSFLRYWWWLALGISLVLGLSFFFGIRQLPAASGAKRVLLLAPGFFTIGLLGFSGLQTHVDQEGISYRFYPMGWRRLAWAQIKSARVRHYSPLREYGGWGIKGFSSNRAYNVAGSYGLQLELPNGNRVLVGTQQPEALRRIMAQLGPEQVH